MKTLAPLILALSTLAAPGMEITLLTFDSPLRIEFTDAHTPGSGRFSPDVGDLLVARYDSDGVIANLRATSIGPDYETELAFNALTGEVVSFYSLEFVYDGSPVIENSLTPILIYDTSNGSGSLTWRDTPPVVTPVPDGGGIVLGLMALGGVLFFRPKGV